MKEESHGFTDDVGSAIGFYGYNPDEVGLLYGHSGQFTRRDMAEMYSLTGIELSNNFWVHKESGNFVDPE